MQTLPIYEIEDAIVGRLAEMRRLVLQAPTGSGKSTQVPQMLLKHGLLDSGQAVILQPRRLAARLLAARVAREMNVELGREVGYQIRFENVVSAATRIKFETEGILLRQMIDSPKLEGIRALLFDEFHERHLYTDITLARALDIQEQHRPDLLIIVMSATLDTGTLEKYLAPTAVVRSEGRTFPVTIDYFRHRPGSSSRDVWELAADTFSEHGPSGGDVLIFMPGAYEINRTIEAIRRRPESRGYILLPLHGELPPQNQDEAIAPYDRPKVVVATNVAETSITIDGIQLVIDSGLARIPRYDPNRGINTLLIEKISQSSADQRAGRAGRTAPGRCIRLWTRAEHDERPTREIPEVKRLDLSEVVLTLKAAGVENLNQFRWLEAPGDKALNHAEELLLDLGALDESSPHSVVTNMGRRMLAFPVHPRYSRMLLEAQQYDCVYEACLMAALTQGRDLLIRNPGKEVESVREDLFFERDGITSSDFWVLVRAWEYAAKNQFRLDIMRSAGIHGVTARQVASMVDQFLRIAKAQGLVTEVRPGPSTTLNASAVQIKDEAIRRCILIGFSDRVARRLDDATLRCELVHGRRGTMARESAVRDSPLLVAAEIRELGGRQGEVNTVLSLLTAIEADWLHELFPNDMRQELRVAFDSTSRRVQAENLLRFRDLVLSSRPLEPPPADAAARILAEEVLAERLRIPDWDHAVEQWILRLNLLSGWCPELGLPPIGDEDRRHIVEQLCLGATSFKDLKELHVQPVVKSWLGAAQRALVEQHAPERITLPNGRTPRVTYEADKSPHFSLRIQELFGVTQTPRIAMGRVPLNVHILAPSMRPVQVTNDLANFWREHYPRIKSELQRKYPKHEWR